MAKKEPKQGPVTVRMLVDTQVDQTAYKIDQAVTFDGALAAQLVESNAADDAPEAVDYVISQGVKTVVHGASPESAEA